PVPAAYYWVLVPMVTLLTLLPVSLNGMGIREGGMVLFLAPLGVGTGTALSLAFLWFAVFTAASLGGGCVYLFVDSSRLKDSDSPLTGSPLPVEIGYSNSESVPAHESVRDHSHQGRTRQPSTAA